MHNGKTVAELSGRVVDMLAREANKLPLGAGYDAIMALRDVLSSPDRAAIIAEYLEAVRVESAVRYGVVPDAWVDSPDNEPEPDIPPDLFDDEDEQSDEDWIAEMNRNYERDIMSGIRAAQRLR